MELRRLSAFGMNSPAYKYCTSSGIAVLTRMLFVTASDCRVSRGTYHITVFLFLVPLIIYCTLFWTDIYCLSSVMVHPSSHKTPNDINGAVFIYGKCGFASLAFLDLVSGVSLCARTPL